MKKIRFTIGNKIFLGFLVLILIFTANTLISFFTLRNNNNIIHKNAESINPSVAAVNEFVLLVERSERLITKWVYLPRSDNDKNALKKLHSQEYPQLKSHLQTLSAQWAPNEKKSLDSIFISFEKLLKIQQESIMSQLVSFESYEDALVKFAAEGALESDISTQSEIIRNQLDKISNIKKDEASKAETSLITSSNRLTTTTVILFMIVVASGIIISFVTARSITKPVNYIKNIILMLSSGELPENSNKVQSNDEIGEMANAVDKLVSGLKSTSGFAENIGNGSYSSEFNPLSEKDVLGNSLIEMRNNLQRVADDDKIRAWSTEGLAKFGDILRTHTDDTIKLSDKLIVELVNYTKSNQGAIFVLEEPDFEEAYLKMTACYAWDRKKYIDQKIELGEGLIGQSWQEKDTLFITDVPPDYVTITSGLGEANPTNILIVPLLVNESVQGVLELASFNLYKAHEIEFVQKIAESVASTISTVKTNEKTKHLLEQSQQMTEEMRAQEEEMRQNMEELEATQEEMRRNEQNYLEEIRQLKEKVKSVSK